MHLASAPESFGGVRLGRVSMVTTVWVRNVWLWTTRPWVAVFVHAADHPIARAATVIAVTMSMTFQSIAVGFWSESANSPRPPRASMASLMSWARRRLATSAAVRRSTRCATALAPWSEAAGARDPVLAASVLPAGSGSHRREGGSIGC